ncbi:hypothetical protein ACFYVL_02150 [Streptomyces sp. NPDC004111]
MPRAELLQIEQYTRRGLGLARVGDPEPAVRLGREAMRLGREAMWRPRT